MNKQQENLNESLRHLQIADHITYITFPLVREKKLFIKIFEEIHKSLIYLMKSVLIFENKKNKIKLFEDNSENVKSFIKLSKNYKIKEEEIKKLIEILEINELHKKSSMEFARKDKMVIMLNDLKTITIDVEKIKEYLALAKSLFIKVNLVLNN